MANLKLKDESLRRVQETITLPRWLVDALREHSQKIGVSKGEIISKLIIDDLGLKKGDL